MGDFDEDKVTRDEHGRFSGGGLGAFAAKHEVPKLSGYAKGGGGLDKWAGKVSGRARDIEVPLASKTHEDRDVAATGAVSFQDIRGAMKVPFGQTPKLQASTMVRSQYNKEAEAHRIDSNTVTKQKMAWDEAGKKADKAEASLDKAKEKHAAAEKLLSQMRTEKPISSAPEDVARHAQNLKDMEKQVKSAAKSVEKATTKAAETGKAATDAEEKWNKDYEKYEVSGERVETNIQQDKAVQHVLNSIKDSYHASVDDSTLEVSRDRKDGSVELHLAGQSHAESHPGEKSLTIRIEHGTSKDDPPKWSIVTQYPTDRRGKDHPHQADIGGKLGGPPAGEGNRYMNADAFKKAMTQHLKNFHES